MVYWQLALLLALILLNGFFAMSELAIVSSRRGILKQRAEAGSRGAAAALKLSDEPTRFLSTIQIGITLIGIVNGAISGATFGRELALILDQVQWLGGHGEFIGYTIVVVAITFFSLVIGELVPKRIAMTHPESIAIAVAPFLRIISTSTRPFVALLQVSTAMLLKLLGVRDQNKRAVTDEEITALLSEGAEQGLIDRVEREMIDEVLSLGDRPVRSMMTHRSQVEWIEVNATLDEIREQVIEGGYGRYLICEDSLDNVLGYLRTRELIDALLGAKQLDLRAMIRDPLVVPPSTKALSLLAQFKKARPHIAIVVDEYGDLLGMITPTDILETIAGDLAGEGHDSGPSVVRREDGSFLVDGQIGMDDLEDKVGMGGLVVDERFATLARFLLEQLGHIPRAGQTLLVNGWRFEVVDMDGTRIDKVLVSQMAGQTRRL
jgi:putative hemolysin